MNLPEQSTSSKRLEAVNISGELVQSGQSHTVSLQLNLSLQAGGYFLHSQESVTSQTREWQQEYQGWDKGLYVDSDSIILPAEAARNAPPVKRALEMREYGAERLTTPM